MTRRQWMAALTLVPTLIWSNAADAGQDGPRLKFRNKGPTCMCVGGLSEEDIRRAERLRMETGERRGPTGLERLDGNAVIDNNQRGDD